MDDSILQDFVIESKDHLSVIEEGLMAMDEGDADVHSIFRSIHSIKGASGFLGLPTLSSLAHIMETLLQEYRDEIQMPTPDGVDALLKGVDLLTTMFDDISNSDDVDTKDVIEALNLLLGKESAPDTGVGAGGAEAAKCNILEGLTFDEEELRKLVSTTDFAFVLVFPKDRKQDELNEELSSLGRVLSMVERDDVIAVLFVSVLDGDMIQGATELDANCVIDVGNEEIDLAVAPAEAEVAPVAEAEAALAPKAEAKPAAAPVAKPVKAAEKKDKPKGEAVKVEETVRISVTLLDHLMSLAGELVLVRNQQTMAVDREDSNQTRLVQQLDVVTTEMQDVIMKTRMQPVGHVLTKVPRMVRDLAKKLGKQIEVILVGKDVELDKTLLEGLADPLTHMVRNSCDHGIETIEKREAKGKSGQGTLTIRACHEGGQILIEIKDDGAGIDPAIIGGKAVEKGMVTQDQLAAMTDKEITQLIMMPGFSTAETISDVSGRGVGMDVVRSSLEKMGGTLEINSILGEGTQMMIRLPLTLAIIQSLVVEASDRRFALPQVNLEEMVCLYDRDVVEKIDNVNGQEIYRLRDQLLPLVRLRDLLETSDPYDENIRSTIASKYRREQDELYEKAGDEKVLQSLYIAVVRSGLGRFGLIIDAVSNTEEIVVKPMHPYLDSVKIYSGATVLGDGSCALIIDPDGISRHCGVGLANAQAPKESEKAAVEESHSALIFRWGAEEYYAVFLPMIRHIERIKLADIQKVGDKDYITIEGQSVLLICLDQHLNVSKAEMKEEMYILLPKYTRAPFGILVSSLEDIVQVSAEIHADTAPEDGFLGSLIVNDKMTLFIDVYRVLESAMPHVPHEVSTNSAPDSKIKVLYAEDSLMFRQIVSGYLKEDGYEIDTAPDGAEALKMLKAGDYDFLLSDLEMPEMGGLELIAEVRKLEKFAHIPAVALTSLQGDEARQKGFDAGFDRYENKIQRDPLLATIAELAKEKGLTA